MKTKNLIRCECCGKRIEVHFGKYHIKHHVLCSDQCLESFNQYYEERINAFRS